MYPFSNEYLTGSGEHQRGLKLETLKTFRVGIGLEKFRNEEDGRLSLFESVYFPLYTPVKAGKAKKEKKEVNVSMKTKDEREVTNAEEAINTEMAEFAKIKLRCAGKEHKHK